MGLLVSANHEGTTALQAHLHSTDGDKTESSYGKNRT